MATTRRRRPGRSNHLPITSERDTPLFANQIARDIHNERQREIERRLQLRLHERAPAPHRSIRRRVGHGLIQVRSMLAADGPLQLAARR
ncbi:MAG: hypothetical protein ABSC46_08775 [Candidatus Limnocylindrales bacterium]|jgi:hypothetical protein